MATIIYKEKILPNKSKILWSLLVFFLIGVVSGLTVFALNKSKAASTTCYFVGDTNPANWNDATHWSSSSGGAGSTCDGGTVPGSDDNVIFDGGSVNTVTVDADINIASLNITSGYTGTFDNATNDKNVTVSGDVTLDGTRVDMGDGTWTVSGNWDSKDVPTLNADASTLIMNGNAKTLSGAYQKYFCNVIINGSITSVITFIGYNTGDLIVNGTLTISNYLYIIGTGSSIYVTETGRITGTGEIRMYTHSGIAQQDGIIDVSKLYVYYTHNATASSLVAATYDSPTVLFTNHSSANASFVPLSGTYTFTGNVTFKGSNSTGTFTVNNSTNNPNFIFKGNVTFTNGTGTLNWTKGTGTITFAGTTAQTADFLDKSVEDIVISNTSATVSLTENGVTTDGLTVDSGAIFDLAGENLSYASASSTTNNGTIRLQGGETLTNVSDLDTDSGTVVYYGDNGGGGSPFTIKDFGTTDYYNLTFDATLGTDVFRPADTLTVANDLTITQGTFDNATNDENINVTGNVVMDNTQTDMGDATWTVSGNFDNYHVTTFNRNFSTLVMDGTEKEITGQYTTRLYNITIDTGATIAVSTASANVCFGGRADINGTLTIPSAEEFRGYGGASALYVGSAGKLTGDGMFLLENGSIAGFAEGGIIDVATVQMDRGAAVGRKIVPGTYSCGRFNLYNGISSYSASKVTLDAGNYVFEGDFAVKSHSEAAQYTLDNSNNPNITFKGDVTIDESTGTANWTRGTGTLTFAGTSAQALDFSGKTVEDIVISNTSATVSLLDNGVTTDSLTVDSGATFDLNGENLSYASASSTTNNGTIKLKGSETLTNVNDLDTNSGDVIYYGTNVSETLTLQNVTYNNLTIDDANATKATFSPASGSTLTVNGNFNLTNNTGTFDNATSDEDITVGGNFTIDNARVNLGTDNTLTVSGDFDYEDVGYWGEEKTTLTLNGTNKQVISESEYAPGMEISFYKVVVPVGSTITIPDTNPGGLLTSIAEIGGTLVVDKQFGVYKYPKYASSSYLDVPATATITGTGELFVYGGTAITTKQGIIDTAIMYIPGNHSSTASSSIPPATYESPQIQFYNQNITGNVTWVPDAGTYTFLGNVTFRGTYISAPTDTFTVDNSVNNPDLVFKGNVTLNNGSSAVYYTKGTGTLYFDRNGGQNVNLLNKSVENIDVTNTGGSIYILDSFSCDSLSASPGATLQVTAGKTITANDISGMQGAEGDLITLRSLTAGLEWYLNVSGTPVVSYVDVKDSNASGGSIIHAGETSVNSGNNINWLFTYSYSLSSTISSTNPGSTIPLTLTLKDGLGNTISDINGIRTLTFSGANSSPNGYVPTASDKDSNNVQFGQPTLVNFVNGVATTTLTLYKVEQASISVTDTVFSSSTATSFTILPLSGFLTLSSQNTISSDNTTYLSSPDVTLTLSLSNVNEPSSAKYRINENQSNLNASSWQPYTSSTSYSFSQKDGYATLYINYQDQYSNTSSTYASNSVLIDATSPSTPTNLSLYNASDTLKEQKIYASALVWSPSSDSLSGIKGYLVSRDGTELETEDGITKTTQLTQNKEGQDVIFYIDPTLDNSTSYNYSVKAIDKAGNTSQAISSSVSIGETISGATTTLTKAENLEINFEQNQTDETITAIVSWATDAPATSQVEYGTGSYSNKTELAVTPSYNTAHTKIIEGLTPETAYNFRAISVDQNNNKASLEQSVTTPESGRELSLFEIIWQKIEEFFSLIWHAIRDLFAGNFAWAKVSSPQDIQGIHVSKVLDVNNKYIGYAIYWQADKTDVALVRDGSPIAAPQTNRWLDLLAQEKDSSPVYTFANLTGEIIASLPGGTPSITDLAVKEIAVTQNSINVEVSWLTRGVASTSQVNYSETSGNYTETVKDESLNEEHSIVVNNLSPEQTYYFTVSSTSSNGKTTTSEEVSYTLPEAAKTKSIFIIIYEALVAVFGGFMEWLYE